MEPAANQPPPPNLSAALDRLWTRFLPELHARVALLESAAQSLAAGSLTTEERQAAQAAAHKLAGVLGTFNLERGTVLARELEHLYEAAPDPSEAPRLAQHAKEIRSLLESRA
jgi:HPt (histidine-containing phosphotransfer) domain-containing protein